MRIGDDVEIGANTTIYRGAISDTVIDIDFGDMASSVGVGLTWITAMGPLSFSLAMPVVKPDDADTQVFQFSLGQTF